MEIISYLQGIGLPIEREGSGYRLKECPLCGHKDCFKVAPEGYFKCFSCNAAGDAFRFESIRSGITYQEAKQKLSGGGEVINLPQPEFTLIEANHKRLLGSPEQLSWLTEQRRISIDTIKRFKIGCFESDDKKTHYSLPYFDGQRVANSKFRTADKKMYFKKGGTEFLFNRNALNNTDAILIVEGEMDCLAAYTYRLNIPTVSVGLGAGSFKHSWRNEFSNIQQIYIAFDNDSAGRSGALKLASILGEDKCRIVSLPFKDLNDCLIQGVDKEEIEACIQKSLSLEQVEIFRTISSIPSDEPMLGEKLGPIFNLIAERPNTEMEDYLRAVRNHFPEITYRQVLDFRNRIKAIKYINKQKHNESSADQEKQIPENLEKLAMELLTSPTLFDQILSALDQIGIIGEEFNKICLWLFFLSRKLDKPIHCVTFGQSSSGKSELVKKVLSTVPEEDVLEFTSMSARSLDYRDGDLIGKVIFIAEADGSDEVEYAIRIAMSEGKLIRGYTIKDEHTGEMKNVEKTTLVKSCFVLTTTRSQVHNENSTRVFSLYVDESIQQTQRVLAYIKQIQSREYRRQEPQRQLLKDVLKTAQRLLKKVEIEIPYAHLLEFPSSTTRNRRDLSRFISFIKVVAFLRQFQKEFKNDEIGDYIEADIQDYFLAYTYLLPVLRNTLDEITPRGMTVLEVCCLIQHESKTLIADETVFTVKDIQKKAFELGIDFKNVVNLRQELQTLCEGEYLELVSGKFGEKGGRHKFRVSCQFEVTGNQVLNIRNLNTHILTPDQLTVLLQKDITLQE